MEDGSLVGKTTRSGLCVMTEAALKRMYDLKEKELIDVKTLVTLKMAYMKCTHAQLLYYNEIQMRKEIWGAKVCLDLMILN